MAQAGISCLIGTDRRMDLGASTGAADRQPVTRGLVWLHGNEGSAFQIGLETCQDNLNPVNNLRCAQALQSETNYGRPAGPGNRQDRVEVRVQGHDGSTVLQREGQDFLIGCPTHPDFPEVCATIPETAQAERSISWNALVEDETHG